MDQTHRDNLKMMAAVPSRLSRMIGAPVLHAAHVGTVEGQFAITPNIRVGTKTRLMGETQIVNSGGTVLSRLGINDGAGVIMADIEIGQVQHSLEPAQSFWSLDLPLTFRLFWAQQNAATRPLYARAKTKGQLKAYAFERNSIPQNTEMKL